MGHYYIFTTEDAKEVVLVKECPGAGTEAAQIRRDLSKKHQKPILAWCHMGGDNPTPAL